MSTNINKAISLTSYLIQLPTAPYLVLGIFFVGFLFGSILNFLTFPSLYFFEHSLRDGFLLLSAPALFTSIVIKLLVRSMPYRRIAATALAGQIVYGIAYLINVFVFSISPFWAQLVLLFGASLVFVLWYVIARFVFLLKYRSILFAILQLLFYLLFLFGNDAAYLPTEPFFSAAAKFYLSSFVLLGALILFFIIINAPMKKNLGVTSTDALSYFFSQWLYHNKDMEKAFEQVGEEAKTIISFMAFKRKNDFIFFVTPYIHFGPFGNLGGSDFSYLLAEYLDKKYNSKTFVFHGTVTHDLNPISSTEMSKICAEIDAPMANARFSEGTLSYSVGKFQECRAHALHINDSVLIGLTRAPFVTEDVNFGVGLGLILEAEKHTNMAMVVDQHNSETGEITSFEPGSIVSYRYLEAVRDSMIQLKPGLPLNIGVAIKNISSETIGKAGIKVAILSSAPYYVLVLIDSNGITPAFRDKIEHEIQKWGENRGKKFEVGVYTTDTHAINMVRGVLNPLREEEKILSTIKEAVSEAYSDLKEAQFFRDKRWFSINVIGAKQSIELIATVNSIVAIAKITLPLLLLGGLMILIAIVSSL